MDGRIGGVVQLDNETIGGIVIATPTTGGIVVTIPPLATRGFADGNTVLVCDLQGQDAGNNVRTFDRGHVIVRPDVTDAIPGALPGPPGPVGSFLTHSTSYTLLPFDTGADFSLSGLVCTMPSNPIIGKPYLVSVGSGGNLTINGGGYLINGQATQLLAAPYQSQTLVFNGSEFRMF